MSTKDVAYELEQVRRRIMLVELERSTDNPTKEQRLTGLREQEDALLDEMIAARYSDRDEHGWRRQPKGWQRP